MRNCFPPLPLPENGVLDLSKPVDEEYEEMTMNEIINGKGESFPGLLGLVYAYLETLEIEEKALAKIERYLDLIRRRANGSLQTPATWIRNFVRSHPDYKNNSVVSQKINYDLLVAVNEIERGVRHEPDLLPADYTGGDQDQGSIGL
jgi:glutamate--cysteine ligase catalytic subunit